MKIVKSHIENPKVGRINSERSSVLKERCYVKEKIVWRKVKILKRCIGYLTEPQFKVAKEFKRKAL